jgi:hypothetical protein
VISHHFDPDGGFLAISLSDQRAQVWRLPKHSLALDEQRRQTWLRCGSRLDDAGNLEVIPAAELQQLEAADPDSLAFPQP